MLKNNNDNKIKQKMSKKDIERMEKHRDEKNPYIGAALFASVLALILAIVPWNYFGDGIGTKFTNANRNRCFCFVR